VTVLCLLGNDVLIRVETKCHIKKHVRNGFCLLSMSVVAKYGQDNIITLTDQLGCYVILYFNRVLGQISLLARFQLL